jgi:hypothetical protein
MFGASDRWGAQKKNRRKTMDQTIAQSQAITEKDREMARKCIECKVCRSARKSQRGLAYWFVKTVEGGMCPYCKAYEKVYGRKAYEKGN